MMVLKCKTQCLCGTSLYIPIKLNQNLPHCQNSYNNLIGNPWRQAKFIHQTHILAWQRDFKTKWWG